MVPEKADALVLRVVDFSETSAVLTLFTREFGKVRGLAKGARRLKGPFESALDLLAQCRIVFLRKSSEALDLLTEARLQRRFRIASRDLSYLHVGYYVAELLDRWTDDGDPHPELYDAACAALADSSAGLLPSALIAERFEFSACRLLGHLPLLDACVDCGKSHSGASGRVAFGLLAGGLLCSRCRPGQRHVVSITNETLRAMQRLAETDDQAWRALSLERRVAAELRAVLNQYISHLLGQKPRMFEYSPFHHA